MTKIVYRYTFKEGSIIEDVESSLVLAILSVESLHGESQTRLEASHFLDAEKRACVIDANSDVGRDLNRIFTGFLTREFGADSFTVERINSNEEASV